MGFPSEGREGLYRNNMKDVQRFFDRYHKGHYKVYNLCSEREYTTSCFEACARYPFDDHNCPKFSTLLHFCQDVHDFLNRDQENVVAVHCKAGKGRTGLVISCYLQFCGTARSAEEGLKLFADARTKNSKGVTIPSQIRYVRYFGELLKRFVNAGRDFPFERQQKLTFTGLQMTGKADFDVGGGCDPYVRVFLQDGSEIYNMKKDKKNKVKNWKGTPSFRLSFAVPVEGDIHVTVLDEDSLSKDDKMFGFWFNTEFIKKSEIKLKKVELDGAIKDKKHQHFNKEFEVTLFFDGVNAEDNDWEDELHGATLLDFDDEDDDEEEEDEDEEEEKHNGALSPKSPKSPSSSAPVNNSANKPVASGIAARMASLNMAASGQK